MARLWLAACLCVAGAVVVAQENPADQSSVFRATSDTVPVYVTVTDRSDRFVTTLTKEQFTLRDNGKAQPISLFDNTPQPVRLIVLVDVSGSMFGNLPLIRAAGTELFKRLSPGDLATVGTFGKDISISDTFTRDERKLVGDLPADIAENAPTPLWRAMISAIDAFGDKPGRRVVLVLSDGQSTATGAFGQKFVGSFEVLDKAHENNVMIYAVAMRSRPRTQGMGGGLMAQMTQGMPSPEFGKTAVETGGGYVEIRPRDDLGATFARIADELHSQYLLGFTSPVKDGKRHDIEVKVSDGGMKLRARKNYVAPRAER